MSLGRRTGVETGRVPRGLQDASDFFKFLNLHLVICFSSLCDDTSNCTVITCCLFLYFNKLNLKDTMFIITNFILLHLASRIYKTIIPGLTLSYLIYI